ncbi:hypothetical protein [Bdellovibrio sp. HCB209]|uniref:hypothetical protein n=1 Tax=Bdellovibrio sp. HCB209 TaxID=3394354 RepID=UPI0039B55203
MLNRFVVLSLFLFSTIALADQVEEFGFGLTHDEMIAQGYKSVIKSSGNEIYEKKTAGDYKKIVAHKNEYVSTLYRNSQGTFLQYTKLDETGHVLGLAECKMLKGSTTTSCDVQTAEICQELIHKMDSGGYGFDLKKIQDCADMSSKISYSRKSIDGFLPEVQKHLSALSPGTGASMIKAPAVSLQTLLKDYAACKKVEADLVKPASTNSSDKDNGAAKKGAN